MTVKETVLQFINFYIFESFHVKMITIFHFWKSFCIMEHCYV